MKDLDKKARFEELKSEFAGGVVGEQGKGRSLRRVGMDFLARREHSAQELGRKMKARAALDLPVVGGHTDEGPSPHQTRSK